jgi:Eukaryotic aspartyl protease
MSKIVRMPISIATTGINYAAALSIGQSRVRTNVILDTGSSALAVDGHVYNPSGDALAKTTKMAQAVQYMSGSWVGAIVKTSVALSPDVTLNAVNLAVTYHTAQSMFGKADGIFGLAHDPLNNAHLMSADTWKTQYDADQITHGQEADLDPYFSQLEEAGIVANLFAFYTKRSIVSAETSNPASDPLNQGVFVMGGGVECADLYTGGFTSIAVLDDVWYNTNLLSIQVGDQAPIGVPQLAPGSTGKSNSIVDSGSNCLVLAQSVYNAVLTAFGKINPDLAAALTRFSIQSGQLADQSQIDLGVWPDLLLTLQGADGSPVVLAVTPSNYWQFDVTQKGLAIVNIYSEAGSLGGQSILGLPLFNSYYVVFDRTAASGHGVIRFANRT